MIKSLPLINPTASLPFYLKPSVLAFEGIVENYITKRMKTASAIRIVWSLNKLPNVVAETSSVDAFKSRLDTCWTEVYPDDSNSTSQNVKFVAVWWFFVIIA